MADSISTGFIKWWREQNARNHASGHYPDTNIVLYSMYVRTRVKGICPVQHIRYVEITWPYVQELINAR